MEERHFSESDFDAIRPYSAGEIKQALVDLISDRQFSRMLQGFVPWLPKAVRNALLRMAFIGVNTTLDFQRRFMIPVVRYVLNHYTTGATLKHNGIEPGDDRYLFLSNHRDIVLDSAILDYLLNDAHFPTTCEIAIGDNLLIYPWIRILVRMNKAFTVRRGLSRKELMESSMLMSAYIHHAITKKRENVWMAQREGRAKDSSDRTQDTVLKMLTLGAQDRPIEHLKDLNIVPLAISYEYDPCDYLKAKEFQQKRDDPHHKKSKQDDLDNMRTGIQGQKGHIHYQTTTPINAWLDELKDLPRTELFTEIAKRIDEQIYSAYRLYPGNYVAYDLLQGGQAMASHYTEQEKQVFMAYVDSRIALVDLPNPDVPFLRERILTMYANPVVNQLQVLEQ